MAKNKSKEVVGGADVAVDAADTAPATAPPAAPPAVAPAEPVAFVEQVIEPAKPVVRPFTSSHQISLADMNKAAIREQLERNAQKDVALEAAKKAIEEAFGRKKIARV